MADPFVPIATGRFQVELRNHARDYIRTIPYNNMQGEWFLNEQGAQLRLKSSYRGLGLTYDQLYAGKHEVWLWDDLVSGFPIFQGPVVQLTADSSDGSLAFNCEDYLWYFKRRLLFATEAYTGLPETAMNALLTYTNARRSTGIVHAADSASTDNISALFHSGDFNTIADLWQQLADMGDGVDYYLRGDGASPGDPVLHLWGNQKKPSPRTLGLVYPGGALEAFSYQQVATGLANWVVITGTGSGFAAYGEAHDATAITAYDAQYEMADSAAQNDNTSLNRQATKRLKKTKDPIRGPSLLVKSEHFKPFIDFDLGDRFQVDVDDEWAQYHGHVRSVGFQITFGANDEQTTNIYTNTEAEVL